MNAFAQTGHGNGRSLPGKVLSWLMSWGPPVVIGLAYFAAYYPGFTNHDSQSMWLNAFQYVGDPATIPVMDWYAPGLTLLRILALESGLGVAGYHALFCQLTFGTWALLVAALLDRPWQRLCAHGLLLLPVIMAVPWLFRCHASPAVRYACIAAPLAALVAVYAATSLLPIREQHKTEIYMAFETIGVWKSVVESHSHAEVEDLEPPRIFAMLPRPPGFYLARWNPSDVDAIIWDLPEFADRSNFDEPRAGVIREDFFRTVFRYPLRYLQVKLSFTRNGLGLSAPGALPVSTPPPNSWVNQLGIPLYHRPLAAPFTRDLLRFNSRNLVHWLPLSAPFAWWIAALMVFTWRLAQGRLTHLDAAWMTLIAAYYLTILLFAPVYLPRYVFPAWVVLGVGTIRLLLNPGAQGSFRDRAGTT